MKHYLVLLLIIIVFASCSTGSKVVKYPTRPDDVFANANLKLFFKATPSPSIVLKVPNSTDKATSNSVNNADNALLYNAIEKELLKEGFSVRDRGLFNELIQKTNSADYSKIRDLTNTDLILEVVNIDLNVKYTTNKLTETSKGQEHEVVQTIEYKGTGVSIQFKLILVKTNEIAGTYNFNYKPCPDGCQLVNFKTVAKRSTEVELKESISSKSDELEEFMKRCTKDLIQSFKNY
jgi:PBP1b-binding outer membrane lipoprotein LpoB